MASLKSLIVRKLLCVFKYKYRLEKELTNVVDYEDQGVKPHHKMYKQYKITTEFIKEHKVFTIEPKTNQSNIILIYLHGGAYVHSFSKIHWLFIQKIVNKVSCTVITPDYPLAPRSSYQETYQMLYIMLKEKYEDLLHKKIVLMGDSSGAGLVLGLSKYIDEHMSQLNPKYILISPWLDLTLKHPMLTEIEKTDPVLTKKGLELAASFYTRGTTLEDPLVSPIFGDIDHLNHITIFTSTYDMLYFDAVALHEKALHEHIPVNMHIYEKMIHVWPLLPVPEAKKAFHQIVEYIKN